MVLVAHSQSAKVAQPGEQPLHLPAALVSAQRAAILRLGSPPVPAMRGNHLNALLPQGFIQLVRVKGSITDYPLRQLLHGTTLKCSLYQSHLVRRSAGGVCGDRKTSAVCHCHELRALAPLGLSNVPSPFLAAMNVPSMKHSERSSPPLSLRSWANALRTRSIVPSRTQFWNRLWQVWYGGYRSGRSCQGAPVLSTHKMPFNTSRGCRHGLPLPSARFGGVGSNGSNTPHCSSVSSILLLFFLPPYYLSRSPGAIIPFMRLVVVSCL